MRAVFVMTCLAICCAGLLTYVHYLTADKIAANRSDHANAQLRDLVPHTDEIKLCDEGIRIVHTEARGYGGTLSVASVFKDGSLTGVGVTEHKETPGFADVLDPENWISQFGRNRLRDINAVTRATISSKAVIRAVQEAEQISHSDSQKCSSN